MPANTAALMHFDSEPWVDASLNVPNIGEDNDPQLDTVIYKFAPASIHFRGTPADSIYLYHNGGTGFDWYPTGDFTIECWAYFNVSNQWHGLCGQHQDPDDYWSWRWDDATNGLRFQAVRGASSVNFFSSWTPTTSTWYHLALVRSGTTWYHFVDGNQQGTTTDSHTFINLNANFYIGEDPRSAYHMKGRMDEFRISDVARWTSNFTPSAIPYVGVPPVPPSDAIYYLSKGRLHKARLS